MKNGGEAAEKPVKGAARKVSLIEPASAGFVVLAVSTGHWKGPLPRRSSKHKRALAVLSASAETLRRAPEVHEATVFTALLRPPGQPRAGRGTAAAYDVVLLVETGSPALARDIGDRFANRNPAAWARERLLLAGSNVRRIGPVDPRSGGVFLFNFFTGPSCQAALDAWQYTASWFEQETGLDNSTVILPDGDSHAPFAIINYCRWNRLAQVLPSLMFKPSFRRFVLGTFRAAGVVPHPILYRVHSENRTRRGDGARERKHREPAAPDRRILGVP